MDASWLPLTDQQLLLWMDNFKNQLVNYQASLGLSPDDILAIEYDYKALKYMVSHVEALAVETQYRLDLKNALRDGPVTDVPVAFPGDILVAAKPDVAVRAGIVPRLLHYVDKLKSASGYTLEIGEFLGIEPKGVDPIPVAPADIVPVAENGYVKLEFSKLTWQGAVVEGQRGDETGWTVLASVFQPPFVDARPPLVPGMAEPRRYRLQYIDSNGPIGTYSQVVQVIFPAMAVGAVATLR